MTNFEIMRDALTRCPFCKGDLTNGYFPGETCYFCKGYGRVNTIKKLYYFLIQPIYYKKYNIQFYAYLYEKTYPRLIEEEKIALEEKIERLENEKQSSVALLKLLERKA